MPLSVGEGVLIPRDDIAGLAWEVQREPLMALDGGNDGLDFYRAICTLWKPAVRDGGLIAFEIGYDIREGVIDIMKKNSIGQINAVKDFNGVNRCIFGTAVS